MICKGIGMRVWRALEIAHHLNTNRMCAQMCLCEHVKICTYIYLTQYTYMCMYLYIYIYVSQKENIYIYIYIYIYSHIYMRTHVCIDIDTHTLCNCCFMNRGHPLQQQTGCSRQSGRHLTARIVMQARARIRQNSEQARSIRISA